MPDHSTPEGRRCPECEGACYVTYPIDHNATRTAPCPRCNAAGIVPGLAATGGEETWYAVDDPESFARVRELEAALGRVYQADTSAFPEASHIAGFMHGALANMARLRRQLAEAEQEKARLIREVVDRNARAVAGDEAVAARDAVHAARERAEARAATAERRLEEASRSWRCFFCDEVFTDKSAARRHFDPSGVGGARSNAQCLRDACDAQIRAVQQQLTASQQEVDRLTERLEELQREFDAERDARVQTLNHYDQKRQEVARLREALEDLIAAHDDPAYGVDMGECWKDARRALSSPHQSTGQGGGV